MPPAPSLRPRSNPGHAVGRVSFSVASGFLTGEIGEFTFGGQAAFHLAGNAEGQVSVQGGVGYLAFTEPVERRTPANDVTTWNFPIGLTFQARPSENGRIWVMPRIDWVRRSDAAGSTTVKDFAFSIGASVTGEAGFGGHVAIDYVNVKDLAPLRGNVGVHYVLGG